MYRLRSGLGSTALASAVFRQEGTTDASGNWIPSSLGYRLNNPGNLNYAGQPGASPSGQGNGSEAQFATLDQGIAATQAQLNLDASRGLTIQQEFSKWATGNQPAYIANVSNWLGVDPSTPLSQVLGTPSSTMVDTSGSTMVGTPFPADTSLPLDQSVAADITSAGMSTPVMAGLAIAAAALLWAVVS